MIHGRIYSQSGVEKRAIEISHIEDLHARVDDFYWVDLVNPHEEELLHIGEHLGISRLALEDAYKGRQRPKIEHHETYVFLNLYSAHVNSDSGLLSTHEIAIFLTHNGLITVRDDEAFDFDVVEQRWDHNQDLAGARATFLLWGLLDTIVDGYFDSIEAFELHVDQLEDMTFAAKRFEFHIQELSYELRKALVYFRKVVSPMREIVNQLIRNDIAVLDHQLHPYFQDVLDHVIRVTDSTEALRDLVTTLLETNLTIQSNNMNLIMKKVTSWAAIIAVPTAITGFYGQNIPYPGYAAENGFITSTLLIVGLSGLLYGVFRNKDWL